MKQFLMLVAVAAVAGAMYAAGASGSQPTKFATKKQLAALQKKVTILTKEIKTTVKPEADFAAGYILNCLTTVSSSTINVLTLPVSQFGSSVTGFLYGNSASSSPRTALDVNRSTPTDVLQEFDPACISGTTALRHGAVRSGVSRMQLWLAVRTH